MLVHRYHDGVEYLDRGSYVEFFNGRQAYTHRTSKGRYFIYKGKRFYIKEEKQ